MDQPLPIHLRPPAPAPTPEAELDALHEHLLAAFIDPEFDLRAVAERFALGMLDVVRWFNSPRTRHDLEALRDIAKFRAQLLADLNLPAAVDTLNRASAAIAAIQPGADEPISTHLRIADTARRNATALQRLATPRRATPILTSSPSHLITASPVPASPPAPTASPPPLAAAA